jgi:hypothetical protein
MVSFVYGPPYKKSCSDF